jgi:DUF4097 and DUF4098 domain-containing protein YvlB
MRILFLMVLLGFNFSVAEDYTEARNLSLESKGIKKLYIDCGAGELKIKGVENAKTISVKAEIYVNNRHDNDAKDFLDRSLELSLDQFGYKAELISKLDNENSFFSGLIGNFIDARVDLEVILPARLQLKIDDRSGAIKIDGMKNDLYIDDGSGSIAIKNTNGNIEISDGSGEILLKEITGDISVDDGSGTTLIKNINGNAEIDDGSGQLDIYNVQGDVTVSDGSGSIRIDEIDGDLIIKESGSGSVSISNVKGSIYRHDQED